MEELVSVFPGWTYDLMFAVSRVDSLFTVLSLFRRYRKYVSIR